MLTQNEVTDFSRKTENMLGSPFEWCPISAGSVTLLDASTYGGNAGGTYNIPGFAISKYLITNGQYQTFIDHPNGFRNTRWWDYSPQAVQWHKDHPHPKPTAFYGTDCPRTRASWFDSIAFCNWLSVELRAIIRLPTEQEWQRAALGDTQWNYPWGNMLDETRANFGKRIGRVSPVGSFPTGQSPFGVMDMIGNLWEWCLTIWGTESTDLNGYNYRTFRGGAWNVSDPDYLRATDRGEGHTPRGSLNDCGFRLVLDYK